MEIILQIMQWLALFCRNIMSRTRIYGSSLMVSTSRKRSWSLEVINTSVCLSLALHSHTIM
ncbi:hypothetical protein IC582_018848 [Cucumis melo]